MMGPFRLLLVATGFAATATMMPACTSSAPTSESTGEYVDDAAITAKVKSQVLADPRLHELQITVTTYKHVVQLSGFVDSAQAKAHAGEVAAGIPGVQSVNNALIVK
jgi:osmotically-inducible protein OsmY